MGAGQGQRQQERGVPGVWNGCGAAPVSAKQRVAWAGLQGSSRLFLLARGLQAPSPGHGAVGGDSEVQAEARWLQWQREDLWLVAPLLLA